MTESLPLKGQVAVITGGSRGIGRAMAIEFARAGADIVVTSRSTDTSPSKLPGTVDDTARKVQALGRKALAIQADVSKEDQVREMARRTLEEFGRVDILVNNAFWVYLAPLHKMPIDRWDKTINVNLRGAVICSQAFLPGMMERKSGRILNLSSGAADLNFSQYPKHLPEDDSRPINNPSVLIAYAVSKIGLEKLTEALAGEMLGYNIGVNALRPGLVASEGAMYGNEGIDNTDWRQPEEPARAALWMLTQPPSFTGKVLDIVDVEEMMKTG